MSYIVPQKMPLRCFECAYIFSSTMDGYSCKVSHKSLASEHGINTGKPNWCPLIEIPTPHGRLIDGDAYIKMMEEKCDHESSLDEWVLKVCRGGVSIMPTVIEAEG